MKPRREHRVTFLSPGTFVSESSTKPIDAWDVAKAYEMAKDVKERYGATPYAFQFSTVIVSDPLPDGEGDYLQVMPREVHKSGLHFIDGKLLLYDDVPDSERILKDNMRCNREPVICETRTSYRHSSFFSEADCLVVGGVVARRGNEPELVAYRAKINAKTKAEMDEYLASLKTS